MTALADEAADRALLAAAFEDWERLARDPDALAAYRSETEEIGAFEPALPDY